MRSTKYRRNREPILPLPLSIARKISIFSWCLRWKHTLVWVVLHDEGMDPHFFICPCCEEEIETINHCFLTCSVSFQFWKDIFKWWGWSLLSTIFLEELFSCTNSLSIPSSRRILWKAVVLDF